MQRLSFSIVLAVALVSGLVFGVPASAKPKKPTLGVRVSPRLAFSPVSVIAVAELNGGEDSEDFYCLAIEWDWDDGSKSLQDSDCEPYEPGTKITRRSPRRTTTRVPGVTTSAPPSKPRSAWW